MQYSIFVSIVAVVAINVVGSREDGVSSRSLSSVELYLVVVIIMIINSKQRLAREQ